MAAILLQVADQQEVNGFYLYLFAPLLAICTVVPCFTVATFTS